LAILSLVYRKRIVRSPDSVQRGALREEIRRLIPLDGTEERSMSNLSPRQDGPVQKRLTCNVSQAQLAGVCAGLADYFEVDPTIVRIIFVLSVLVMGFGILPYVILWIIMPPNDRT